MLIFQVYICVNLLPGGCQRTAFRQMPQQWNMNSCSDRATSPSNSGMRLQPSDCLEQNHKKERGQNDGVKYNRKLFNLFKKTGKKQDSVNTITHNIKSTCVSELIYLSGCVSLAKYLRVGQRSMRLVGSSTTFPALSLPGQRKIPGTLIPPSQPPIAFPPTCETTGDIIKHRNVIFFVFFVCNLISANKQLDALFTFIDAVPASFLPSL